jgi:hypothetical protein
VQAPSAPGRRLVPERAGFGGPGPAIPGNEEIRLTYSELTALIEDAVRHLK